MIGESDLDILALDQDGSYSKSEPIAELKKKAGKSIFPGTIGPVTAPWRVSSFPSLAEFDTLE